MNKEYRPCILALPVPFFKWRINMPHARRVNRRGRR